MIRSIKIFIFLFYRFIAYYLPKSSTPFIGFIFKYFRYFLCRFLFAQCGFNVNVERGAYFGMGGKIIVGNNSGLGANCLVPSDLIMGDNVMMGPDCIIYSANHNFTSCEIPMNRQGHYPREITKIGNDVWIGSRVIILPGKKIGNGVIIGAGSVITKDCDDFGIYGGNPARLIKFRNGKNK